MKVSVTQSCVTLCDPMDCCLPGSSRQECESRLPFPSPGDLPDPGIEPRSPALAGGFFTAKPPGKLMAKSRDRYIQVPKKKIMEIHSL